MSDLDFTTCDLSDAHEGSIQVVAPGFLRFGKNPKLAGVIATVKCHEDNQLVKDALALPGAGKVLVIDGGGSMRRALVGDLIAASAVKNGWSGIVVNGCIRDSATIDGMPIAIRALGTHPTKTVKRGWGETDGVVHFGGATFRPGEWIYADEDGIVLSATKLTP